MLVERQNAFYYITLDERELPPPAMPAGAEEGILRDMNLLREGATRSRKPRVQLLDSPPRG